MGVCPFPCFGVVFVIAVAVEELPEPPKTGRGPFLVSVVAGAPSFELRQVVERLPPVTADRGVYIIA